MEQTAERTIDLRGARIRGEVSAKPDPMRTEDEYTELLARLERDAVRQGVRLGRELAAKSITRRRARYSMLVWIARVDALNDLSSEDMARLDMVMIRSLKTELAKRVAA